MDAYIRGQDKAACNLRYPNKMPFQTVSNYSKIKLGFALTLFPTVYSQSWACHLRVNQSNSTGQHLLPVFVHVLQGKLCMLFILLGVVLTKMLHHTSTGRVAF